MKFYTSGDSSKPVILLVPGTCCHWTFFQDVIPLLNECFYTITVSFDGFDETENQSDQLKGVLPKEYTIFSDELLSKLLRIFNNNALHDVGGDVICRNGICRT